MPAVSRTVFQYSVFCGVVLWTFRLAFEIVVHLILFLWTVSVEFEIHVVWVISLWASLPRFESDGGKGLVLWMGASLAGLFSCSSVEPSLGEVILIHF